MGNSVHKLTPAEADRLKNISVFTPTEILALWNYFHMLSNEQDMMTKEQFKQSMIFENPILADRVFKVFDSDNDGMISIDEYIVGLSTVSSKAQGDEKLKLAFKIYDCDGDGFISVSDLTTVVSATLGEQEVVMDSAALDAVVEQTFKEANPKEAGLLAYDEYLALVANRPYMLSYMTFNISNIITEYTAV